MSRCLVGTLGVRIWLKRINLKINHGYDPLPATQRRRIVGTINSRFKKSVIRSPWLEGRTLKVLMIRQTRIYSFPRWLQEDLLTGEPVGRSGRRVRGGLVVSRTVNHLRVIVNDLGRLFSNPPGEGVSPWGGYKGSEEETFRGGDSCCRPPYPFLYLYGKLLEPWLPFISDGQEYGEVPGRGVGECSGL